MVNEVGSTVTEGNTLLLQIDEESNETVNDIEKNFVAMEEEE